MAATAVEELLRQEHEVLLGQAPVALHFGLEFHVERLAQLRPQDFVRHCKRHPALVGREARTLGENSCMIYSLNLQKKNTDGWMELQTLVWLSLRINSNFLGVCISVKFGRFHFTTFTHNLEGNLGLSVVSCK